jgi:hypothetical protein
MPEENPVSSSGPVTNPANVSAGSTIRIGDEFGTAKRNLPPIKILLLAVTGVLIVAGAISFFQRATPQAGGTIVNVSAVQIPNQNAVLVALTFSLRSAAEKSLWVKSVQGKLVTADGEKTGEALSAMDFDRYFQAFPELSKNAQPALAPEDKLRAGQDIKRTVIVSFPVTLENFNHRKSVSLILQPYDQPLPVVLGE